MPAPRGRAFAELRPGAILVLAPGTLHLPLASRIGDGRDGGTTLARGTTGVNEGRGARLLLAFSLLSSARLPSIRVRWRVGESDAWSAVAVGYVQVLKLLTPIGRLLIRGSWVRVPHGSPVFSGPCVVGSEWRLSPVRITVLLDSGCRYSFSRRLSSYEALSGGAPM